MEIQRPLFQKQSVCLKCAVTKRSALDSVLGCESVQDFSKITQGSA